MMNPPCVPVDEPAAKRPCRIDSAQDLLSLMNATEETKETVTPETAPSSVHKPKLQTSRQAPVVPAQRPQARAAPPAAESENWRRADKAPPPPPDQLQLDEQIPDDTLNVAALFCDGNFKSALPNERGRGALAAAALCLLERLRVAPGHVHVVRSGQHVDRWLLNRMPGRTDALLHFVNGVMVSCTQLAFASLVRQKPNPRPRRAVQGGMLGLKPFSSWRALARSLGKPTIARNAARLCVSSLTKSRHFRFLTCPLPSKRAGDSRDYLPARHWRCLELKGGGVNASAKQPWQAYRAVAGHFDRLADELEVCLMTRQSDKDGVASAGKGSCAGASVTGAGPPAVVAVAAEGASSSVLSAAAAPVSGPKASRQLQFIAKRESLLAKGHGSGASSATGRPFRTRQELALGLQADWTAILAALHLVM